MKLIEKIEVGRLGVVSSFITYSLTGLSCRVISFHGTAGENDLSGAEVAGGRRRRRVVVARNLFGHVVELSELRPPKLLNMAEEIKKNTTDHDNLAVSLSSFIF